MENEAPALSGSYKVVIRYAGFPIPIIRAVETLKEVRELVKMFTTKSTRVVVYGPDDMLIL